VTHATILTFEFNEFHKPSSGLAAKPVEEYCYIRVFASAK